jgi:hypothetical protein
MSLSYISCVCAQASYEAFVSARNSLALDVGHVLEYCKTRQVILYMQSLFV